MPSRTHAYAADESHLPTHKPFPGMDPCIERTRNLWDQFHLDCIHDLTDAINAVLPPAWTAMAERRATIHGGDKPYGVRADVDISPLWPNALPCPDVAGTREHAPHGVMMLDPPRIPPSILITADGAPVPSTWIEVMSLSNKDGRRQDGPVPDDATRKRDNHLRKRDLILAAGIDYVEIDLLRGGKRTHVVPDDDDFLVYIMRPGTDEVPYWPISMRDEMPGIRIPVGTGSIPVDLQAIVDGITDKKPYRGRTNYNVDLGIDDPAVAAWAERRMAPYR